MVIELKERLRHFARVIMQNLELLVAMETKGGVPTRRLANAISNRFKMYYSTKRRTGMCFEMLSILRVRLYLPRRLSNTHTTLVCMYMR